MKNKILLLLLLISVAASSQNSMTLTGSKYYKATPDWSFISDTYALTGIVHVQIAKTDTNGILKIAVETTNPKFLVSGTVYVYLTDNTIITCSDKGNTAVNGNTIIGYYNFSNSEMTKLKTTNIDAVRFNIKGNYTKFGSPFGNFTAYNKTAKFESKYNTNQKNYETAKEIKAL